MTVSILRCAVVVVLALLLPFAALAQPAGRTFRVGWLMLGPPGPIFPDSFVSELANHGYSQGKNLVVELRSAGFEVKRLGELANGLVNDKVDVIVALTHQSGLPASSASARVPVVIWGMHDSVGLGLVRTLARPGGNVTGVEGMGPEIDPKRVELLTGLVPGLKRLGVLHNADDPAAPLHIRSLRAAGLALGITLELLPIRRPDDVDEALAPNRLAPIDALFVVADELTGHLSFRIGVIAAKARLPTICEVRLFAEFGCLLSYGPSFDEFTRLAAAQVDRVLKGAKPADLPVQQVTRFELVLNAKTAATIGVDVPNWIRLRADDVIQ